MASFLQFHLTGGNGNTDPDASLGGVTSGNRLNTTALNNLFDNVNPDETLAGDLVEYRAFDIVNEGDAVAQNIQFYVADTANLESDIFIWYEASPGQTIPDEGTEPTGASGNWTQPLEGSKLSLGNLNPGSYHRIWVRRTVAQNATNLNEDTATLYVWFS